MGSEHLSEPNSCPNCGTRSEGVQLLCPNCGAPWASSAESLTGLAIVFRIFAGMVLGLVALLTGALAGVYYLLLVLVIFFPTPEIFDEPNRPGTMTYALRFVVFAIVLSAVSLMSCRLISRLKQPRT